MRAVEISREIGGMERTVTSHDLADDLVSVAREAAEIDLRSFEERDRVAIREELVPKVRALVYIGLAAMDRVLELHDEPDQAEPSSGREGGGTPRRSGGSKNFYVDIDRAVGVGTTADRSIQAADLAFMARMELRETAGALGKVDGADDRWRLLALCDSCLRGLRKASSAVERALARHAGFEPRLEFVTELHMGRVVRAYYARFRREIERGGTPDAETVHRRLLSAAASIAKLIGRDFYGDLRVDDRAELRLLQERLRSWLRGEDGHDPEAGVRLWQDLQGFTVLLAQINRRSELVEHDRRVVRETLDELAEMRPLPDELPPSLFRRLERLKGRSDRVDELLAEPASRATGPWLAELQRLDRALRFGSASGGNEEFETSAGGIEW